MKSLKVHSFRKGLVQGPNDFALAWAPGLATCHYAANYRKKLGASSNGTVGYLTVVAVGSEFRCRLAGLAQNPPWGCTDGVGWFCRHLKA